MNISEVPEGHWMLLDNNRKVLFHSESIAEVCEEGQKYSLHDVSIERKFTGLMAFHQSPMKLRKY